MHLGQEIRKARKRKGMTQAQLAARLGVRHPSVSRWESAAVPEISRAQLGRLCEALGMDVGMFFEGVPHAEGEDGIGRIVAQLRRNPQYILAVEAMLDALAAGENEGADVG